MHNLALDFMIFCELASEEFPPQEIPVEFEFWKNSTFLVTDEQTESGAQVGSIDSMYYLIFNFMIFRNSAPKEFPPEEIPVILKERQVQVTEEFNVFVLHLQFIGGVPVNYLKQCFF